MGVSLFHAHSPRAAMERIASRVSLPVKNNQPFTLNDAPLDVERGAARNVYPSSLFPSHSVRETICPVQSKSLNHPEQSVFPISKRAVISPAHPTPSENIHASCEYKCRVHFFCPLGPQPPVLPAFARPASIHVLLAHADNRCRCAGEYAWAFYKRSRMRADG